MRQNNTEDICGGGRWEGETIKSKHKRKKSKQTNYTIIYFKKNNKSDTD